jgi:hypothetical protein
MKFVLFATSLLLNTLAYSKPQLVHKPGSYYSSSGNLAAVLSDPKKEKQKNKAIQREYWPDPQGSWRFICKDLEIDFKVDITGYKSPRTWDFDWSSYIAWAYHHNPTNQNVIIPINFLPTSYTYKIDGIVGQDGKVVRFHFERERDSTDKNFHGTCSNLKKKGEAKLVFEEEKKVFEVSKITVSYNVTTLWNDEEFKSGFTGFNIYSQKNFKVRHLPSDQYYIHSQFYTVTDEGPEIFMSGFHYSFDKIFYGPILNMAEDKNEKTSVVILDPKEYLKLERPLGTPKGTLLDYKHEDTWLGSMIIFDEPLEE